MKYTYAQKKRIHSLATRYLRSYDGLIETKDLNQMYHSDFMFFVEDLLVEFHGYKREDPKPDLDRPRKVGERPKKRPVGQKPPKIKKNVSTKENTVLSKNVEETIQKEIDKKVDKSKPNWYKKAWRKVMMSVHPDRVDTVSKNDIDKLERLKIGDILREDNSPELLIACANKLDLIIEMNVFEQERILRVANHRIQQETKKIQDSVTWVWGEASVDTNLRLQIIKTVLRNNNIEPTDDNTLIQYILKNSVQ